MFIAAPAWKFLIVVIVLLSAPALLAQSAAPAQFEVASVKLVDHPVPMHPYRLDINHGTLTVDAVPPRFIIGLAYQPVRVEGGPNWLNDERYDIQAKAGNPNATREEIRAMLQTLLAERFKLTFHREMKQFPVYTLEVGKNGPKLKEAKDDERPSITNNAESGMLRVNFQKWPMAGFANTLSGLLGNPVQDKTGLTGLYDFKLDYMRETAIPARDAEPGPSIFTAVQEQLGLRLEEQKAPVEVMIIDHVDHASAN